MALGFDFDECMEENCPRGSSLANALTEMTFELQFRASTYEQTLDRPPETIVCCGSALHKDDLVVHSSVWSRVE